MIDNPFYFLFILRGNKGINSYDLLRNLCKPVFILPATAFANFDQK